MKSMELTVTRIGKSRGVRFPAEVLRRYHIKNTVIMEQRPDGLVLRPKEIKKLSWEETYKQMAQSNEDWSDWESLSEGLNLLPGEEKP